MLTPNTAGLCLALLTALFWGALPLAVKQLLPVMDAVTIVCLRFCVAAVWIWICPEHATPRPRGRLSRRDVGLLVLATVGLGANFVLFNTSVGYLSASACQILAQAGPMLLLLGGVFLLHEPFLPIQGFSAATLIAGLLLFFIPYRNCRGIGETVLGFGFLFLGMVMMSDELTRIADFQIVTDLFARFDCAPVDDVMPLGAVMGGAADRIGCGDDHPVELGFHRYRDCTWRRQSHYSLHRTAACARCEYRHNRHRTACGKSGQSGC